MARREMIYLAIAAENAGKKDGRHYRLGCLGIRADGTIVYSRNLRTFDKNPRAHAEARISRKLDYNAEVFITRVDRLGYWRNARPCMDCLKALKQKRIKRICYSISNLEYGIII
jgi:tRNA(Arg) A34 adenosine deaminase TadA